MLRKKILLLLILMIILFLMGNCVRQPQESANLPVPKEVQLTEEGGACGSGVGLNTGDTLVIILQGDPSMVNIWEVGFFVPEVIKPASDTIDRSEPPLESASGTQTFRFLAVGEGQAQLRMIYHDPLEENAAVIKICEVNVEVK